MLTNSVGSGRLLRGPSALASATVDLHGCRPADAVWLHGRSGRFYRSAGSICLPNPRAATAAGAAAWLHMDLWQCCGCACDSCLPLHTAFMVPTTCGRVSPLGLARGMRRHCERRRMTVRPSIRRSTALWGTCRDHAVPLRRALIRNLNPWQGLC